MTTLQRQTLLDGFWFTESPRWHDGAFWFSDMMGKRVHRSDLQTVETIAELDDDEPSGLGWLADGRLLIVAMETQRLLRREPDGRLVVHADLSDRARGTLNDMIVAADGTAFLGDTGYPVHDPNPERIPGQTFRVDPDGTVSVAADDLASPNGHLLTADGRSLIVAESGASRLTAFTIGAGGVLSERRTFADISPATEGVRAAPPDGICPDADGAVWLADPIGKRVLRVLEGGEVTDTIDFDDGVPLACVLGGSDRRTLLICVVSSIRRDEVRRAPVSRIDAVRVLVPGGGRP